MKIFWRLLTIVSPAWPAMLGASLLALLTVTANVGLMATAAYLISTAAGQPPLAALTLAVVGVRFFGLSRAVFRYAERYLAHGAAFTVLGRLRVWFYKGLEPLVPAGLARFRSGELFTRIVNDIETLQFFYLRILLPPAVAVLAGAGAAGFLAGFGRGFAVLLIGGFVGVGLVMPVFLYYAGREAGRKLPVTRAALATNLADSIRGMRDLAAYGQTGRQAARVGRATAAYSRCQARLANLDGLAAAGGSLVMNLTVVGAVLAAAPLIDSGRLDGVYLAVIALAIQSSFEAVLPLPFIYRYWPECRTAAERLLAVIEEPPAAGVVEGKAEPPAAYDIAVTNLKFRYRPELAPAVNGLSFNLPPGGKLAVVGPSGAGKSTLFSLLLRFGDYEAGRICIGGREISSYDPAALRAIMGVVRQDDHIFNVSLFDNIRLARSAASRAEVLAAADRAALGRVIAGLPAGIDTVVGENGYGLSGGERRRVIIARAVLKNAPILLLDEPAAGIDAVTEREIMNSLAEFMAGRTTILVTHRLTGLAAMDEIVVIEAGRVVEQGGYTDLINRRGLFYQMWRLQNDCFNETRAGEEENVNF